MYNSVVQINAFGKDFPKFKSQFLLFTNIENKYATEFQYKYRNK